MTDFLRLDMTVASTGNGAHHFIGFDVLWKDWPDVRDTLVLSDPKRTIDFREPGPARTKGLGNEWCWVWVRITEQTPVTVLMELAKANRSYEQIKFVPGEFP